MSTSGNVSLPTGSVDTDTLADSAVTSEKAAFTEFSTSDEVAVGTWIDGKTIYRKTFNLGAGPNATIKSTAHGLSIDKVLRQYGTAEVGLGDWRSLPVITSSVSGNYLGTCLVKGANIVIITTYDATGETFYFTVEYTKPS